MKKIREVEDALKSVKLVGKLINQERNQGVKKAKKTGLVTKRKENNIENMNSSLKVRGGYTKSE